MPLFKGIDISATGLTAERLRMDIIASNIANADSTRSPQGGAYRRLVATLAPEVEPAAAPTAANATATAAFTGAGVRVTSITQDQSALPMVYDPGHPDANPDGYVQMPNVNPVTEMVDLITASRAYEANVTVMNAAKQMAMKALEIGKA